VCRVLYTMDSVQFCSGALYPTPSGRPCQEALNSPSHREWFPGRARCRWSQFVARSGAGRDPERSWLSNTRQGDGTDPCKYGGRLSFEGRVSLLPVGMERSVGRNDRSRLVGSTINPFIVQSWEGFDLKWIRYGTHLLLRTMTFPPTLIVSSSGELISSVGDDTKLTTSGPSSVTCFPKIILLLGLGSSKIILRLLTQRRP